MSVLNKIFHLWPLALSNLAKESATLPVLIAMFPTSFLSSEPSHGAVPLYSVQTSDRGLVLVVTTLQN